jgi:hypothetical protein
MNIDELVKENILLREENEKLKIKLEKYYNSRQSFYEKNKDYVKEKANERLKKLAEENPEKLKQYRRTAYLNQKEKRKQKELEIKK